MSERINVDHARSEFYGRKGGVASETLLKEAHEWLTRALDTLHYPSKVEQEEAIKKGYESIKSAYSGQSTLEAAEDFFKEEQKRLAQR